MKFRYNPEASPPAPFFPLRVSNLFEPSVEAEVLAKVLLGRDVLNHLRLLLDGPALTLEILPPA
jgi:hypothetical protein